MNNPKTVARASLPKNMRSDLLKIESLGFKFDDVAHILSSREYGVMSTAPGGDWAACRLRVGATPVLYQGGEIVHVETIEERFWDWPSPSEESVELRWAQKMGYFRSVGVESDSSASGRLVSMLTDIYTYGDLTPEDLEDRERYKDRFYGLDNLRL